MRAVPPYIDGVGAGFAAFLAGAESVTIDISRESRTLRKLARHADIVVESFRPGTLDRWDAGPRRLLAANPGLVVCSLSSYGAGSPERVGHDLNFAAESGLLDALRCSDVPRVQVVDVAAGLLAANVLLAALVSRERTGRGGHFEAPLADAVSPFLAFAAAERAAGGGGAADVLLAGRCAAYGVYACADGARIALGLLEPKFWVTFVEAAGIGELAGSGLDCGDAGVAARSALAARISAEPAEYWLRLGQRLGLPITAVRPFEALAGPALDGGRPPRLGEHTGAVFVEFGVD